MGGGIVVFFLFLLIVVGVVIWIVSAKTFVVARTASGSALATGTSMSERAAAEEMYSLILAESMSARQRMAQTGGIGGSSPVIPRAGAVGGSSPAVPRPGPPPPPRK